MGIRITQSQLTTRTLSNLNDQLRRLSVLQDTMSTGRRVNSPSDDPIDARRAISIQTSMDQTRQYISNLEDIAPHLSAAEAVFEESVNMFQRALELTLRAANGTFGQDQLDQNAEEINQLLEQLILSVNTETSGRRLFSGTRTLTEPFSVTRDVVTNDITAVTYQGNSGAVEIPFSEIGRIQINIPGDEAFQKSIDVFATICLPETRRISEIRASLKSILPKINPSFLSPKSAQHKTDSTTL